MKSRPSAGALRFGLNLEEEAELDDEGLEIEIEIPTEAEMEASPIDRRPAAGRKRRRRFPRPERAGGC